MTIEEIKTRAYECYYKLFDGMSLIKAAEIVAEVEEFNDERGTLSHDGVITRTLNASYAILDDISKELDALTLDLGRDENLKRRASPGGPEGESG